MRFLVFNADAERRDGLKALLRQIDRRATCADAADQLQVKRLLHFHEFDLILADWHDVRRLGELAALCQQCDPIPIVMMIDQVTPEIAHKLYAAGVRGVVPRTMQVHLIVRALEIVVLGGVFVPSGALSLAPIPDITPGERETRLAQRLMRQRRAPGAKLSARQAQIMRYLHMGCTNKMIAKTLGISEGTVKIHLSSIFQQLGATNRAAALAIYNGWLPPNLEVLLSEKESSPKPVYGAPGVTPLRKILPPNPTYPRPCEQMPLPLAAEPTTRYRTRRDNNSKK